MRIGRRSRWPEILDKSGQVLAASAGADEVRIEGRQVLTQLFRRITLRVEGDEQHPCHFDDFGSGDALAHPSQRGKCREAGIRATSVAEQQKSPSILQMLLRKHITVLIDQVEIADLPAFQGAIDPLRFGLIRQCGRGKRGRERCGRKHTAETRFHFQRDHAEAVSATAAGSAEGNASPRLAPSERMTTTRLEPAIRPAARTGWSNPDAASPSATKL